MIEKKYFIFIVFAAVLPLLYYIQRSDVDNWWNITKNIKKETLTIAMDQTTPKNVPVKNVTVPTVPTVKYILKLGPTSPYYNKTPPSDQVGKDLSNDITVVSLYLRLPPFPKGSVHIWRSPPTYIKWMKAFHFILNPIVVYTDDNETYTSLTNHFKSINKTSFKVIMVQRKNLWSFQQLPVITKIFKQKGYPVHYPNTVVPAYNCMTHTKFEVLQRSIKNNYFKTKYFVWVDIGYFRYKITEPFGMDLPSEFDQRRIGITSCGTLYKGTSLEDSVRHNRNWIAGGCILGRLDVLSTFCKEYLAFVKKGIEQKMLGVEQQMMYAMFSAKEKPKTSVQLCTPGWFCMGRLAVEAWSSKHKSVS